MANGYVYRREVARSGVSMGAALAIAISWSKNGSILWAILHGIFFLVLRDLLRSNPLSTTT